MPRSAGIGVRISTTTTRVIQPDAWREFSRRDPGIAADLSRRATNVQAAARAQVGKRTWRLHDSIVKRPGVDSRGPYVDVVTEGVRYALYHHNGTDRWHGNAFLSDNLRHAAR